MAGSQYTRQIGVSRPCRFQRTVKDHSTCPWHLSRSTAIKSCSGPSYQLVKPILPVSKECKNTLKLLWVLPIFVLSRKGYVRWGKKVLFFRSMLARDLQSIVLYDTEGKFSGVRRPNSKLPIEIDGMKIVIEDAIGSTGLELKVKFLSWLKKVLAFFVGQRRNCAETEC